MIQDRSYSQAENKVSVKIDRKQSECDIYVFLAKVNESIYAVSPINLKIKVGTIKS